MPQDDNTLLTLKVPASLHRQIKIEAAHSGKEMRDLITEAWELYKQAVPQPWREVESKRRKAG